MEAELAGLASSGAATLVGLMVSDGWAQARERLARFLGRGRGADTDASVEELETSRGELTAARATGDEDAVSDIEAAWRNRLRRALRADAAAAGELRSLLAELASPPATGGTTVLYNSVSGGTHYAPVLQGQNVSHITFHPAPAPPAAESAG